MTKTDLFEMSKADKILILMAYDVFWMPQMDARPGARYSRISISLLGRTGFLDYSAEDLDSEIEDYAEDFAKMAESCDELIAWAQETTGVQCVDVDAKEWKWRPGMAGIDVPSPQEARPRGIFGELVKELDCIRDESSEEEGFIYVNGRIDKKLLGGE